MSRGRSATLAVAAAFAIAATACFRDDARAVTLAVPDMATARDLRIVTNAALNEIVGRYDGIKNDAEADLARGLLVYHEGERLRDEGYRRHIAACLRDVGYDAAFLAVRLNPPPPVPTSRGLVQLWPDRHTAVLAVQGLKTARDVQVALDAIAFARTGDRASVAPDARSRTLRVTYNSRALGRRNVEHAIANAGYAVNDTPALLGRADALAMNWTPVRLP